MRKFSGTVPFLLRWDMLRGLMVLTGRTKGAYLIHDHLGQRRKGPKLLSSLLIAKYEKVTDSGIKWIKLKNKFSYPKCCSTGKRF